MTRQERKELDTLSKAVFGSSSRWQKLVTYGHKEAVMEEKEEIVPPDEKGEGGGVNMVKVPVAATKSGGVKYVTKHYTEESIKEFLLQQKKNLDDLREQINKHQEDMKAQRAEEERIKKLNAENAGSAT